MKIKKIAGLSLIEVIVFIIVVSISAVGIFNSFGNALINIARPQKMFIAQGLAMRRMEIILGQRRVIGYSSSPANYDICKTVSPTPAVCGSAVSGYTVDSTIVNNGTTQNITVSVTGDATYGLSATFANSA